MSIQIRYRKECDRCAAPFGEILLQETDKLPDREGTRLRLFSNEELCLDWRELCPSCVKTTTGLIERLRLASPGKKTPAPPTAGTLPDPPVESTT